MEKYPEKQPIELLVNKLEQIELEVRTPIPVNETVWSKLFGETKKARQRREREQLQKAAFLRQQRVALINAFIPPDNMDGLFKLAQVAIGSYATAPTASERVAWRMKLQQCVQLIDASAMDAPATLTGLDMKLAYVRGELVRIEERERAERRLAVQEIAFTAVAGVGGILLTPLTFGMSFFVAVVGILVYWLGIRKKLR